MRATLNRRTLLLGAFALTAAGPGLSLLRQRGYDTERRRVYGALVESLLDHGALPDPPSAASSAADRLSALYADALPARRREIDEVLDGLGRSGLTRMETVDRVALLRRWAASGGDRRQLAARAVALAAAAYGPVDDRALPVVI